MDLSAAYDTVWHRGLTLKLLKRLPSKDMVRMVLELISNRSFYLFLGNQKSRRRQLKNGVPQGSVLAPLLFNVYTADLPPTSSNKYIYADDTALLTTSRSFKQLEDTLSKDLQTMQQYFHNWRLKLNANKTVCTAFYLANRLAKYELKVSLNNQNIQHERFPKYLGITLDRTLMYKTHITQVAAKTWARNNLLRRLASTKWGADFKVLRSSGLALAFSTAEYCVPVWCRSTHTQTVDSALNDTMRLISGCIRSTPTEQLPIVSGILPPDIRRNTACLKLANRAAAKDDHLLHRAMHRENSLRRLASRRPAGAHLQELMESAADQPAEAWSKEAWQRRWDETGSRLYTLMPSVSSAPRRCDLPRRAWTRLNRLRTGHGCFRSLLHKMGLCDSPMCACGEEDTAAHALTCAEYALVGDLAEVDDELRQWLTKTNCDF